MPRLRSYLLFLTCSSLLIIFFPWGIARAQTALPPAVDAFVSAANALAKSAGERVDLGRASERMNIIRSALTIKLLAGPIPLKFSVPVTLSALLCDVRASNIEVAARRNFIQSVAARIDETGKPSKIDNLETAFRSLVSSQTLDITVALPTAAALEENRKSVKERCERDLGGYHQAYYGNNFGAPEPLSDAGPAEAVPIFAAIGALIDTISKIITPVVIEGAKIVDEQRRRDAVLSFLGASNNIKRIEESGIALSRQVSTFTWEKRLRLAGGTAELAAVLRNVEIDLTKDQNCRQYAATGSPMAPDNKSLRDDFTLCYRAAWAQIEVPLSSLLKSADQYDQLADAGDTDNARKAFEPLAKSLAAISAPGDDGLIKFWNWAIRLVAFAQKVETAFNKENRDKIERAIDDLVKAR